jgi:dTMP kinase
MPGILITIEGIDGAGKSTQAQMLAEWLRAEKRDVVLTREPGGTELGERLRPLLLDGQARVGAAAELFLYAADRAQHVEEVIRPALAAERVVICERYSDSTAAYQGYGRGLDTGFVQRVNQFATGGLVPDLTLLLDVAVELARARMAGTPDRLERQEAAFHERVRAGYLELARVQPERLRTVDAAATPQIVFGEVQRIVSAFLASGGAGGQGGER